MTAYFHKSIIPAENLNGNIKPRGMAFKRLCAIEYRTFHARRLQAGYAQKRGVKMKGYQPKGGMCTSCEYATKNCSHLDFKKMPVISKSRNDVIVKCTSHEKINRTKLKSPN